MAYARTTTQWMLYAGLSAGALTGCGEDLDAESRSGEPTTVEDTGSFEGFPPTKRVDDAPAADGSRPVVGSRGSQRDAGGSGPVRPSDREVEPHIVALLDGLLKLDDVTPHYIQPPLQMPLWLVGVGPCGDCALAALIADERARRMQRMQHDQMVEVEVVGPEGPRAVLDHGVVCDSAGACALVLETGAPATTEVPRVTRDGIEAGWSLNFTDRSGDAPVSRTWSLDVVRLQSTAAGRTDLAPSRAPEPGPERRAGEEETPERPGRSQGRPADQAPAVGEVGR